MENNDLCWATMISQGSLILWKLQLEFNKEIELLAMMELRLLTGNVCSTANATFYIPVWNASSHSKFIMSITYHLSTIILLDCFLLVSHKHLWSSKPSIITSMIWRTKHHQKQALDLQVCKLSLWVACKMLIVIIGETHQVIFHTNFYCVKYCYTTWSICEILVVNITLCFLCTSDLVLLESC